MERSFEYGLRWVDSGGGCIVRGGVVNNGSLVQNLLRDVVCGMLASVDAPPLSGEPFSLRRGTRDIQDQHCTGLPPGNTMTAWGQHWLLPLILYRWCRSIQEETEMGEDY